MKPDNIVIEGGKTGGRVFLVDFGGVQAAAAAGDSLGSTIVGTYGYMAPEQFRGAASPASDLYGLGGTLLYLLSGRPPSAFPVDRMRTDFSAGAWEGRGSTGSWAGSQALGAQGRPARQLRLASCRRFAGHHCPGRPVML